MKTLIAMTLIVTAAMADHSLQGLEKFHRYHADKDRASALVPFTLANHLSNPATLGKILTGFAMNAAYKNTAESDVNVRIVQSAKSVEYRYDASEYSYYDAGLAGLAGSAQEGDLKYLPQAKSLLAKLFSAPYELRFVNTETTTSQLGAATPKVEFLTYRFVPVVKGRVVLGSACQARIEFGANGAVRSFTVRMPDFKQGQPLTRRFKEAYSERKLLARNSETWRKIADDKDVPVSATLQQSVDSYVTVESEQGTTLIPSQTYLAKYDLETGKSVTTHINISESPDFEKDADNTDDEVEEIPSK